VRRWVAADSFDLTLMRDAPPIPVTPADIESSLEDNPDVTELEARGGASILVDLRERIPDRHPQIEAFFFGDDQSVWIMRAGDPRNGAARPTDVYDRDGVLWGTVDVALAARPLPRLRGGWLGGVVRDELGVEVVALYRVR
jgi:hypothetical protein